MIKKLSWKFNRDRRIVFLVDKINELVDEVNSFKKGDKR